MGTSMSLSEKQKLRQHFRNHAIPRKNIGPELQKHYRYRVHHMKQRSISQYKTNNRGGKMGIENKNAEVQVSNQYGLPNDIPSIEQHSRILRQSLSDSNFSSRISSKSMVQTCQIQKNKRENTNYDAKQKHEQKQQQEVKYSNIFIPKSQADQKQDKNMKEVRQDLKVQSNNGRNSVPTPPAQLSNNVINGKKSSSGSKKSSDKISSSVSNHILSQIILKREPGYYTVNYEEFKDDIIRQSLEESRKQNKYLTQEIFPEKVKQLPQMHNNQNDDEQTFAKQLEIKSEYFNLFSKISNKQTLSKITKIPPNFAATTIAKDLNGKYSNPSVYSNIDSIPLTNTHTKPFGFTLQIDSNIVKFRQRTKSAKSLMKDQANPLPQISEFSPFMNKTNTVHCNSNFVHVYSYGQHIKTEAKTNNTNNASYYCKDSENLGNRPRKLLYF